MRDIIIPLPIIGIFVINAMATFYNPVRGMIVINSVIILSTSSLEIFFNKRAYSTATLIYDRLELLAPEKFRKLSATFLRAQVKRSKKSK